MHGSAQYQLGLTPAAIAAIYAANWAVADWYIDGVVGNDINNGIAAATPLKTGAELLRRLGPYAIWGQSVTVHVLANGMIDGLVLNGLMEVVGTHVDVVGTPTVLATDTIGSYAAINHATPTATQITGTAVIDWTPYRWARVRITSGARADAVCWIAKASPGGVGVATARVSAFVSLDIASNSTSYKTSITPLPGDPFAIERLPSVPSISLHIDGPSLDTVGFQYARRQILVRDVSVAYLDCFSTSRSVFHRNLIFGCRVARVEPTLPPSAYPTFPIGTYGCSFFDSGTGGNFIIGWCATNCLFGENATSVYPSNSCNLATCLLQGVAFSNFYCAFSASSLQIFDVAGATSPAFSAGFTLGNGIISNISGSGNAGYGILIYNVASLSITGTVNLLGTVSNARLGSAPAINLTFPQLLQPDDYAQKGTTGAMVAGAVTVTVPWYDNVNQKITATHAAVAGTQGILRVTQTSTTQFTITSSSNLDTSTVNWTISPLGRNIFITAV
jgi:hypothetical protein